VKDKIEDLLADSHNILNRWKNYFSQLLNMHRASDQDVGRCIILKWILAIYDEDI
jgi:hypothetical protein